MRIKSRVNLALWLALTIVAGIAVGGTTTASAATPVMVGGKAVVTNTDGDPIRIRTGAGTTFAQLAWAYQDQTVGVLDGPVTDKAGIRWFNVQAPNGTGWMMAEFLAGVSAPSPPAALKLTGSARVDNTDGDPLRVRTAPNTGGSVLTMFSPGTTVTILGGPTTDSTGVVWYKVTAKGVTGWVMGIYLVQLPAAPQVARQDVPKVVPVVAVVPAAPPAPAATPTPKPVEPPKSAPPPAPKAGGQSTQAQYRQWMEEARVMYPYKQTVDKMWSVMMCESGGNARASGGGGRWLGLFQYAPGTWGGSWNPYRGESIWDGKAQIFATAKAWSIGMQSHWSCYYHTAGR